MPKIAADIAILLPGSEAAKVIDLTKDLPDHPTRLNTKDCLPHVTLAMGMMDLGSQNHAAAILHGISKRHQLLEVPVTGSRTYQTPDGKMFSELVIERTDQLAKLHEDVVESFRDVLSHENVSVKDFYSPPTVAEVSTGWVKNYYANYDDGGIENFHPHITLGQGKAESDPMTLRTSRMGLCHLGTYCTCRHILVETNYRRP